MLGGHADIDRAEELLASMAQMFEVVVGNVGTVYSGDNKEEAERKFDAYMNLSMSGYGRVAYETVTLMQDGEIIAEFEQ
jgi:hypothetical protein